MKTFVTIFAALLITFTTLAASPTSNGALPIYDTDGMAMNIRGNDHIHRMGTLAVELHSSHASAGRLTVENAEGKSFAAAGLTITKGLNVLKLNVTEIPAGVYFVKVKTDSRTETLRFVVQ